MEKVMIMIIMIIISVQAFNHFLDVLCGKLKIGSGQTITSRCIPVTSATNISIIGDFSSGFLTWPTIDIFVKTGGKCDCGVVLPLDASCR